MQPRGRGREDGARDSKPIPVPTYSHRVLKFFCGVLEILSRASAKQFESVGGDLRSHQELIPVPCSGFFSQHLLARAWGKSDKVLNTWLL